MIIRFTVPGEPRGWARARTGQGHHFVDSKTHSEKQAVAAWALEAGAKVQDGPLRLVMYAYLGIPKSASKKRRAAMLAGYEHPTKKPDVDNVAKLTMDALRNVCWRDDVQVVDLLIFKRWDENPRLAIEISPLAGDTASSVGVVRNKAA